MWKLNSLAKPVALALLPFCTAMAALPAAAQSAASAAPVVKYDLTYDIISPVQASHGMVASEQELATQSALRWPWCCRMPATSVVAAS